MARTLKPTKEELHKYISASQAMQMASRKGIDVSLSTMLAWVVKHNLGIQPGGPSCRWYIEKKKFQEFLNGKN